MRRSAGLFAEPDVPGWRTLASALRVFWFCVARHAGGLLPESTGRGFGLGLFCRCRRDGHSRHASRPREFDSGLRGGAVITPLFRASLKGVVKLAVVEAGGQENCANVSGRIRRAAAFSDYANPALEDRHIPLDVAVELDSFNGNGRILSAAAALIGFVLVRLPDVALGESRLGKVTARAMKECADVFSHLAGMLEDDKVTTDELPAFEQEVDEAIAKLMRLKLQARAEAGRGQDA